MLTLRNGSRESLLKLNGRARVAYLKEYVLFDISDSDILSSVQLSSQVEALNEEVEQLSHSISRRDSTIEELQEEVYCRHQLLK